VQRKLLDILACPIDKHHPLQLLEFELRDDIVVSGALLCDECGRFYPIIDEIPVMLPDERRNKSEDMEGKNAGGYRPRRKAMGPSALTALIR
jgi:uncharacterized protein YbaR (Trm112 family)